MPIPSLPIEIVGEIVTHLRTPEQGDTKEAIESGQSLALVCRRWCPIGQALRWKDLVIDIVHVVSLFTHFTRYHHLPRLVSTLKQILSREDWKEEWTEAVQRGEMNSQWAVFASVVSGMTELRELKITALGGELLEPIWRTASRLPRLSQFWITALRELVWTTEFASSFADGFNSLREFAFIAKRITTPKSGFQLPPPRQTQLRLVLLQLAWNGSPALTRLLLELFLPCIATSSLSRCAVIGSPNGRAIFEWWTTCPKLRYACSQVSSKDLANISTDLVHYLPRMMSLAKFRLDLRRAQANQVSPITLATLLAALPPNLWWFNARQLCFTDYQGYENSNQTDSTMEKTRVVEGLYFDGMRNVPLELAQYGEDGTQWYRSKLNGNTWTEIETMRRSK